MKTRYCICSQERAKTYNADTDKLILGERHSEDWVEFDIENEYLYNCWFTEEQARKYIERYELEDCEVIALCF